MSGTGKEAERQRQQAVEASIKEGFVLAQYFYDALVKFERDPAGLKDTYSTWIYQIDVGREKRRAEDTEFAKSAAPELLRAPRPQQTALLDLAEQKLAAQDAAAASKLAQQALGDRNEDPARALFILARAAAANGDMPGAQTYFERTLDLAREPLIAADAAKLVVAQRLVRQLCSSCSVEAAPMTGAAASSTSIANERLSVLRWTSIRLTVLSPSQKS